MRKTGGLSRMMDIFEQKGSGYTFNVSTMASLVGSDISGSLSNMRKVGCIDRVGHGIYRTNEKTMDYRTMTKPSHKKPITMDVLQNLLNAMAAAEPEIHRLMELDRKISELARGHK